MRMMPFYHDKIMEKLNKNEHTIFIDCSCGLLELEIKRVSDFIISLKTKDGIIIKYHTNKLVITRAICKNVKNDSVVQQMWLLCITLSGGWT